MKEKTRIRRLPPCPPYDVEGMESWLSDMAAQGWQMEKKTLLFDLIAFQKAAPQSVRYRLEAAPARASYTDKNDGNPEPEALELNAEQGWEYVGRRDQFYIYRNESPAQRELNTDPRVQALTLKAVQKRQVKDFIGTLFGFFLFPVLYIATLPSLFNSSLILLLPWMGLLFPLLTLVLFLWTILRYVLEFLHLQRLKKKLNAGLSLDHGKNWKGRQSLHRAAQAASLLLLITWIILARRYQLLDNNKLDHSALAPPVPFATMADFTPGEYVRSDPNLHVNYVKECSNSLTNQTIEWVEAANIHRPDGSTLTGSLRITYYDARFQWLADKLVSEHERVDREFADGKLTPLECPDFGLDHVSAYTGRFAFTTVVLQKGHVVLYATFFQYNSDTPLPLEDWAGTLANSIRSPDK